MRKKKTHIQELFDRINGGDDVDAAAEAQEIMGKSLEALAAWQEFWDKMPKGQLGKLVFDVGLLNIAFIKTGKAMAKAKGR
jgi:translation elongation factor EF-Ts